MKVEGGKTVTRLCQFGSRFGLDLVVAAVRVLCSVHGARTRLQKHRNTKLELYTREAARSYQARPISSFKSAHASRSVGLS